jgi:hypothetical protein
MSQKEPTMEKNIDFDIRDYIEMGNDPDEDCFVFDKPKFDTFISKLIASVKEEQIEKDAKIAEEHGFDKDSGKKIQDTMNVPDLIEDIAFAIRTQSQQKEK